MIYAVAGHLAALRFGNGGVSQFQALVAHTWFVEVDAADAEIVRFIGKHLQRLQEIGILGPFSHNGAGDGGVRIGRMVRAVNVGFYRFGSVPHVLRNILGTVHNATCKMARNRPTSPKAQARNVSRLSDIMRPRFACERVSQQPCGGLLRGRL